MWTKGKSTTTSRDEQKQCWQLDISPSRSQLQSLQIRSVFSHSVLHLQVGFSAIDGNTLTQRCLQSCRLWWKQHYQKLRITRWLSSKVSLFSNVVWINLCQLPTLLQIENCRMRTWWEKSNRFLEKRVFEYRWISFLIAPIGFFGTTHGTKSKLLAKTEFPQLRKLSN